MNPQFIIDFWFRDIEPRQWFAKDSTFDTLITQRFKSIYDSALVIGDVQVGEGTWVGPFTVLDGVGGLRIGKFCSISAGVQIYTHDSVEWALSGGKAETRRAPTTIGDRCYIGPNVVIVKGVTIGDGTVIGANSVVIADVPAGSVAHGNPCRVVRRVDDEHIGGGEGHELTD